MALPVGSLAGAAKAAETAHMGTAASILAAIGRDEASGPLIEIVGRKDTEDIARGVIAREFVNLPKTPEVVKAFQDAYEKTPVNLQTPVLGSVREALLDRLRSVRGKLEGTRFKFSEANDHVEAMCPWGNRYRIYEPDPQRFGRMTLGFPYVEFDVPVGSAHGIAAFYGAMLDAPAGVANGDAVAARVTEPECPHSP